MISQSQLESIFGRLEQKARIDRVEVEALFHDNKNFSASYQNGNLDKFVSAQSHALGLRILKGGGEGFAYTESLEPEAIDKAYHQALKSAPWIEKEDAIGFQEPSRTWPELREIYNPAMEQVTPEQKLEVARRLEEVSRQTDKRIVSAPYNGYHDSVHKVAIFNTKGLYGSYLSNSCGIYAYTLAKQGDDAQMDHSFQVSRSPADLDPEKVGKRAAELSLQRLGAQVPKTGRYAIVFQPDAVRTLLDAITGMFSARSVDEKSSIFAGRLGEQVASPLLTLTDDPLLGSAFNSRPFDFEGTVSRPHALIENGVLKTFLTNSYYAHKLGLENTGNAMRSPSTRLGIAASNLIVQPGSAGFSELVRMQPKMISITQLKGMAGFDPVSGQFSIESEGDLYENGERVTALKNFVVSGNVMQFFKNIIAIGSDVEVANETVIAPSIAVSELSVAGK